MTVSRTILLSIFCCATIFFSCLYIRMEKIPDGCWALNWEGESRADPAVPTRSAWMTKRIYSVHLYFRTSDNDLKSTAASNALHDLPSNSLIGRFRQFYTARTFRYLKKTKICRQRSWESRGSIVWRQKSCHDYYRARNYRISFSPMSPTFLKH